MLKWSENLIVGDTLRTRKDSIIARINDKKPVFSVYLLTLPSGSEGQLDIVSAYFLVQDRIREMTPEILGIFGSRKEALSEITKLAEECYAKNGNADLQQYLRDLNVLQ
ncbi:MAG: hypothetical protein IKF22_05905 [Lachnospiraceae bacterium]|jgi:hypothetical protein|nr:hypothetical protein [Lachnospiraceae bacterium]